MLRLALLVLYLTVSYLAGTGTDSGGGWDPNGETVQAPDVHGNLDPNGATVQAPDLTGNLDPNG